jgi:hypothetical protein
VRTSWQRPRDGPHAPSDTLGPSCEWTTPRQIGRYGTTCLGMLPGAIARAAGLRGRPARERQGVPWTGYQAGVHCDSEV